eukprot:CAMPEP_0201550916 /NCGR_PEP_ID=MMETSP0173_2-20130828/7192_1 /ASSEMBLY_ACC=CAM_ASM_000268 /TAXON_ID=218659 /ORGANISM="Vexillifera sp., Strain DIVA3 564/2" /LENGTH=401 /DNA_ID=CAMNT_0047961033 /DNA_START=327 /DNA_END=1532 /DNA_ORIENTATION=+
MAQPTASMQSACNASVSFLQTPFALAVAEARKTAKQDPSQTLDGRFVLYPTQTIGSGSYGQIFKGTEIATGRPVCVKVVNDADWDETERVTLSSLSHPNVLEFIAHIRQGQKHFLITELAQGGDLFDFLDGKARVSETTARPFFRQLVDAFQYVHRAGVVHRDVKLENIFLDQTHQRVIIGDFGFATFWSVHRKLSENCGTLYYLPPELVLEQQYTGPEVDTWSLGVLLYYLVVGSLPFDSPSDKLTEKLILATDPFFPAYLSPNCRHLLSALLKPVSTRITLDQVATHPWLANNAGSPASAPSVAQFSTLAPATPQKRVVPLASPVASFPSPPEAQTHFRPPSPTDGRSAFLLHNTATQQENVFKKKRRVYRCGLCKQPKRGHRCPFAATPATNARRLFV